MLGRVQKFLAGRLARSIHSLQRLPRDLLLLFDQSESMGWPMFGSRTKLSYALPAASDFFAALFSAEPDARAGLIAFDLEAHLLVPLSDASQESTLQRAVSGIRTDSCTNIVGALSLADKALFGRGSRRHARKQIVLLTDGCHNAIPSPQGTQLDPKGRPFLRAEAADCIPPADMLKAKGVEIATAGYGKEEEHFAPDVLRHMASLKPGSQEPLYRFCPDGVALVHFFEEIAGRVSL